jgi:hypothetical protein
MYIWIQAEILLGIMHFPFCSIDPGAKDPVDGDYFFSEGGEATNVIPVFPSQSQQAILVG